MRKVPMKRIIILDTNALMAIGQFKIDIFSEIEKAADFPYEIRVLDKTEEELKRIREKQKGKHREAARLAEGIIKKKRIEKIKGGEGKTDEILIKLAKKGAIVVTQDKELKKRIKKEGGKVMDVKGKRKIAWG